MSDQIEAAGAFVTAGLAAQALDRPHGGEGGHGGACANCAAPLAGAFCAQCGQRAHLHRHVGEVFHEFLHGITHLDGKAWQTLPMLMFRPGRLTRRYIEGQRARYIAPVPMFLMVVFLMFFALSFVHLPEGSLDFGPQDNPAARAESSRKALADINRELAAARAKGDAEAVSQLETSRAVALRMARPNANLGDAVDELGKELKKASDEDKIKVNTGNTALNRRAREALKDPGLVLYKVQTKAYKLSFLLVPLSLPWLWLAFFWRRGVEMYDHAVFTLYSISFMSLLFIVGSLALTAGLTWGPFWIALAVAPAVHMFAQLRGAYGIGWWGAAWRTVYLMSAAAVTLSLYLIAMIVVGLLD